MWGSGSSEGKKINLDLLFTSCQSVSHCGSRVAKCTLLRTSLRKEMARLRLCVEREKEKLLLDGGYMINVGGVKFGIDKTICQRQKKKKKKRSARWRYASYASAAPLSSCAGPLARPFLRSGRVFRAIRETKRKFTTYSPHVLLREREMPPWPPLFEAATTTTATAVTNQTACGCCCPA